MPRRMNLGRAVLFAGSALLLVSLFTEWYDIGLTGWQVFESLDLVLAALAVVGLVAAIRPDAAPPWAAGVVPGAAVVIVLVQLIDGPPAAGGSSPAAGAWVALAGAFLMAGGAALSLAAISVTVQFRERDVRRRVAAVDRRGQDLEADEAEDLDADADGPVGTGEGKAPSLFAGLGRRGADDDDLPPPRREDDGASPPPGRSARGTTAADVPSPPSARGTGRFAPRDEAPVAPAPVVSGTPTPAPAPVRPEAADLERTQPLSALPDDEEDAERP
jgi:hypothetical protein